MTPKTLIGLIVGTAVLVLAGLFLYEADAPPSETAVEGQLVYADLMEKINDVAELTIATSAGEFHVKHEADTWGLVERGGYPVLVDKVRSTLIGLAEMKTIERKTDNPALYGKLGVQSVEEGSTADNPSMSVTVKSASGETLAALIVGKARAAGSGATFFVRRIGEAESWLVEGERPPLPSDGDEWLDKKILELARTDIRAGRTTHADGETLTIAKKDSETEYTVLDQPQDRELKYDSVAGGIASSMQYLNFEDVKPAAEFEAPETPVSVTSLWTKDGMRMTARVYDLGDETTWATFHADYDLDGTPQIPAPTGPQPEEPIAEAVATPRPEAEVRAELDGLNARLSKWAYKLPQFSKTNFTKRLEDMLKPLPEETTEPAPALPGDGGSALDALEGPPVEVPTPTEEEASAEEEAVEDEVVEEVDDPDGDGR
jgi:Domain of unknown function (DUF4340)